MEGKVVLAAIKKLIETTGEAVDGLESIENPLLAESEGKDVLSIAEKLQQQLETSSGLSADDEVLAQYLILGFMGYVNRGIAISHFNTDNHVFEDAGNNYALQAIIQYQQAVQAGEGAYEQAEDYYQIGWLNRLTGDTSDARDAFQKVIEMEPDGTFGEQAALRLAEMEVQQEETASGGLLGACLSVFFRGGE